MYHWISELTWYLDRHVFPIARNEGVSIRAGVERVTCQRMLLMATLSLDDDSVTMEMPGYVVHQLRDRFDDPDLEDALGPTFRFDENGSAKSRFLLLQNLSAEYALARICDRVKSAQSS